MYEEDIKQQLLSSAEENYENDDLESYHDNHHEPIPSPSTKHGVKILAFVLFLSLLCNLVLLTAYFGAKSQIYLCPSEYCKLLIIFLDLVNRH